MRKDNGSSQADDGGSISDAVAKLPVPVISGRHLVVRAATIVQTSPLPHVQGLQSLRRLCIRLISNAAQARARRSASVGPGRTGAGAVFLAHARPIDLNRTWARAQLDRDHLGGQPRHQGIEYLTLPRVSSSGLIRFHQYGSRPADCANVVIRQHGSRHDRAEAEYGRGRCPDNIRHRDMLEVAGPARVHFCRKRCTC